MLGGYGTGAVMGVPAHDERDFEFARKYGLEVKYVIGKSFGEKHSNAQVKLSAYAYIYDEKEQKLLVGYNQNGKYKKYRLPGGTIEQGENLEEGLLREIKEETGYSDVTVISQIDCNQAYYYVDVKQIWRENYSNYFLCKLNSNARQAKQLIAYEEDCPIVWISFEEFEKDLLSMPQKQDILGQKTSYLDSFENFKVYLARNGAFTEKGIVMNSDQFSGLTSDEAITKMQSRLAEKGIGGKKLNFKIQDWVFSRQRYWGEPFPIVFDQDGQVIPLQESDLPLLLPDLEHYEPTGTEEGPLAEVHDWVNTTTAEGKPARRETNTMPGWAGSSWYWLRYMDPKNDQALVGKEKEKYWQNVDVYVGGAEHVTRHMIYARFRQQFLYDL